MSERIGLLGSGGQADEAESYYSGDVVFRAVSEKYLSEIAAVDINNPSEEEVNTPVCAAVGAPAVRRDLIEEWSGNSYKSIISEKAYIDDSVELGEGSIVAPNSVITTRVKIGRHAIINVAATIQHESLLGDFVTIGPGSHIAGNVIIEDGVFVGIGAVVSNDIRVSKGVVVGAGATLVHDADVENGVYVGTPAKLIKVNEGWLSEV